MQRLHERAARLRPFHHDARAEISIADLADVKAAARRIPFASSL
jgi:hypothetical protein